MCLREKYTSKAKLEMEVEMKEICETNGRNLHEKQSGRASSCQRFWREKYKVERCESRPEHLPAHKYELSPISQKSKIPIIDS